MSLDSFTIIKKLGEGSYATVYKVQRISDGKVYAMKKVNLLKLNQNEKKAALNEVRIMASIQHRQLCNFYEAFMDESSQFLCIIMEFSDKGDLYARIQAHAKIKKYIKEKEVWRVFIQLVQALKVLHDS